MRGYGDNMNKTLLYILFMYTLKVFPIDATSWFEELLSNVLRLHISNNSPYLRDHIAFLSLNYLFEHILSEALN